MPNKNNPQQGDSWSYRGVKFSYSLGYFYLNANGDMEFKRMRDMKRYINRCYIPAMQGMKRLFTNPLIMI